MFKERGEVERHKAACRAFTLVELLVVIATITLLMAILVPVLGKAKRAAQSTYCQANLRSIGVGFRSYLDDNGEIMPPACRFPSLNRDPNAPNYKPPITDFILPLLKEPGVFRCPGDTAKKYYLEENEGLSYEYNRRLGGRHIRKSRLAIRGEPERNIHVLHDFDPFHGPKNYLYADTHIGDSGKQE